MLSALLVLVWIVLFTVGANLDTLCYGMLCYGAFCCRCLFAFRLFRASFRFALPLALRRMKAFVGLLLVMALLCFASVCFAFCFAPLCLVVCFFEFDWHIALLRFDSLFVAMHCCFVLCLALLRF